MAQSPDIDRDASSDAVSAERAMQIVDTGDGCMVKSQEQVATFKAALPCGSPGSRAYYAHGGPGGQLDVAAQALGDGDCLRHDAQVPASHAPVLQELQRDPLHRVDCGCKADALGGGDDGRIHADDSTGAVAERTAGITGIQRGIGLDDIVDHPPGAAAQTSPQRAHNASGDRALEAEGIADGNCKLPDAQGFRAAQRQRRHLDASPKQRRIRVGVLPNEFRIRRVSLSRLDPYLARSSDDVTVSQNEAIGSECEAGSSASRSALLGRVYRNDRRAYLLGDRRDGVRIGVQCQIVADGTHTDNSPRRTAAITASARDLTPNLSKAAFK